MCASSCRSGSVRTVSCLCEASKTLGTSEEEHLAKVRVQTLWLTQSRECEVSQPEPKKPTVESKGLKPGDKRWWPPATAVEWLEDAAPHRELGSGFPPTEADFKYGSEWCAVKCWEHYVAHNALLLSDKERLEVEPQHECERDELTTACSASSFRTSKTSKQSGRARYLKKLERASRFRGDSVEEGADYFRMAAEFRVKQAAASFFWEGEPVEIEPSKVISMQQSMVATLNSLPRVQLLKKFLQQFEAPGLKQLEKNVFSQPLAEDDDSSGSSVDGVFSEPEPEGVAEGSVPAAPAAAVGQSGADTSAASLPAATTPPLAAAGAAPPAVAVGSPPTEWFGAGPPLAAAAAAPPAVAVGPPPVAVGPPPVAVGPPPVAVGPPPPPPPPPVVQQVFSSIGHLVGYYWYNMFVPLMLSSYQSAAQHQGPVQQQAQSPFDCQALHHCHGPSQQPQTSAGVAADGDDLKVQYMQLAARTENQLRAHSWRPCPLCGRTYDWSHSHSKLHRSRLLEHAQLDWLLGATPAPRELSHVAKRGYFVPKGRSILEMGQEFRNHWGCDLDGFAARARVLLDKKGRFKIGKYELPASAVKRMVPGAVPYSGSGKYDPSTARFVALPAMGPPGVTVPTALDAPILHQEHLGWWPVLALTLEEETWEEWSLMWISGADAVPIPVVCVYQWMWDVAEAWWVRTASYQQRLP